MPNKREHLSFEERFCIEKILSVGESFSYIANVLGRNISTISVEVSLNGGIKGYNAREAENKSNLRQFKKKERHNKVAGNDDLKRFVKKYLKRGFSPETISKFLKAQNKVVYASPKSIRKYSRKLTGSKAKI